MYMYVCMYMYVSKHVCMRLTQHVSMQTAMHVQRRAVAHGTKSKYGFLDECSGATALLPFFWKRCFAEMEVEVLAAARASCRCTACLPPAWQALARPACGLDGEA